MTEPQTLSAYFTYCKLQKNLDNKTLKAYQIDLKQFVDFYPKPTTVTRTDMELYIEHLMERYKASTVKRKIAALSFLQESVLLQKLTVTEYGNIFDAKFMEHPYCAFQIWDT